MPLNRGFDARNLKSAVFPKVDGEYQTISQEQVAVIIEKIKNKGTQGGGELVLKINIDIYNGLK